MAFRAKGAHPGRVKMFPECAALIAGLMSARVGAG
jgi:hypothetical protein